MQTTYNHQMDGSLAAYILGLPADLKLPTALKPLVKAYDGTFTDWDNAVSDAELTRATLSEAGAKDKTALIAALENGNNDPGTAHVDTATRSAQVADEKVRLTARRVNTAAAALEAGIREHADEALAAAADRERQVIATVTAKWAQIAAQVDEVTALHRRIGEHVNAVAYVIGHPYRVEPGGIDNALPPLHHRNNEQALATIDRLIVERPHGAEV
jgi:hypothetical protein